MSDRSHKKLLCVDESIPCVEASQLHRHGTDMKVVAERPRGVEATAIPGKAAGYHTPVHAEWRDERMTHRRNPYGMASGKNNRC